ncbi:MAG: PAS-domain containing protein [Rhizobiaceae bacterium]|nr:PAS-domain containing protein [Rhizobiaceae bacterium]
MTSGGTTIDGAHASGIDWHGRALTETEAADLAAVCTDWIWETDAEHRFSWLSESFEQASNGFKNKMLGRSRVDFIDSTAQSSQTVQAHLEVLEAREPFRDFTFKVRSERGSSRWVSVSGVPRFDAEGTFIGYRGIGRDVTASLVAIDELREVRKELSLKSTHYKLADDARAGDDHTTKLMAALDAMQDAFCYYDSNDRLLLYNKALVEMYPALADIMRPGITYEELLNVGLERGVYEIGDVPLEVWRDAALKKRREEAKSESILEIAGGRVILHRDMRTEDGGMLGVRTDITELKAKEAGLTEAKREAEAAQKRLRDAIDALQDGFVLWDENDRLVVCNKAFRAQFSYLPNLEEGRKFEDMFLEFARTGLVKEAVGREEEWVAEHCAARDKELGQEVVFQTHDGRWMMRRDLKTDEGDRVGIRTDISEHKQRAEELAAANARSEELLVDLHRTLDTVRMGVVLVNADLEAEIINRAFFDIWRLEPGSIEVGSHFRVLMDVNRHNGIYDVSDDEWEGYVESRLKEICAGDVQPREFHRADGRTMIYSVAALTGGKRLVCYYDITEIKDREEALELALEKTRLAEAVVNSVKDPIFVKDSNLDFVLVNNAFAKIFGVEPERMIGRKGGDFVTPEEAVEFERTERNVLVTGEQYEVEEDFEFRGAPQSRIVRKSRVRLPGDKDYVACSIFDISEMKRREREANDARTQLESVIGALPAGVVIYDRDDRFVLASRKVYESLPAMAPAMEPGRSLREAVELAHGAGYFRDSGDEALDALYDTDREAWIEGYSKRYYAPQGMYERQNPDGRWYQVFDSRTPEGFFIGVRVEITELREREDALRKSMQENEVYRSLIDNVPVAIYAKRPDLKLMYVNKGWCELTGHTEDEAIGRTDAEIFGQDGGAFMDADRALLEEGTSTIEREEVATNPDGSVRYQMARKSVMTANDGSLYLIGSTTDVTELKNREMELEEARMKAELADRAKSEFLANMSHEIRTPMNGVLGMAELMAKTELDSKQRTFIDIITKSGNALLTIINDILDFSKIDAGQLVLDPAPFDLSEAIEDVATLVSTRAKEKDLELIVRVEPGLHKNYIGDVGRIRQIVTNLMGNAVKFTEAGHVLVDVTGTDLGDGRNRLKLSITDTGIGIPKDKLALIFEKFSQVDASSTRRHEGTGLGLAITSRLIELMGGEVSVESEEGQGSTFHVLLDLERVQAQEAERTLPLDVTGSRVLIVDDNAVNRAIYTEQMSAWTFDACAAESAAEGLRVLKAASDFNVGVDCVILDYQMPGMNGVEMAKLMARTEGICEVPVILLTSVDQALIGVAQRDMNIAAQLVKPVRSSQLLETVVSAIQKRRGGTSAPAERDLSAFKSMRRSAPVEPATATDTAPAQAASALAVEQKPEPVESGADILDVLVAEDNEVNQLVFSQILGETDLTFEIVANGKLAVEANAARRPRMILMDVSMPEMNGLEAAGTIRAAEAESGGHVPIVGVTAHALKGDRERCIEAGMDDYLSKPISPKALLEKVQSWLAAGNSRRQVAG